MELLTTNLKIYFFWILTNLSKNPSTIIPQVNAEVMFSRFGFLLAAVPYVLGLEDILSTL